MYILYTKNRNTNKHTHTHNSLPHRKHSSSPMYTKHIYTKKNEVGIPYPLLTTANEADSAYVCDSKMGYGMQLEK